MVDKLFQGSRFSAVRAASIASAALVLAFAGIAMAQPAAGHAGPHAAMMGQGGGDDEMIGHLIAHAEAQLSLNTSQKLAFDAVVAQSKAARDSGRALHQKVKDALAAELAKTEPDLAAVAAVGDSAQQQGIALRHQVRDAWLQLYGTFTPDQKAVVRDMLQKHIAHMTTLREKIKEHISGGG